MTSISLEARPSPHPADSLDVCARGLDRFKGIWRRRPSAITGFRMIDVRPTFSRRIRTAPHQPIRYGPGRSADCAP
jgi:hypothetical protein